MMRNGSGLRNRRNLWYWSGLSKNLENSERISPTPPAPNIKSKTDNFDRPRQHSHPLSRHTSYLGLKTFLNPAFHVQFTLRPDCLAAEDSENCGLVKVKGFGFEFGYCFVVFGMIWYDPVFKRILILSLPPRQTVDGIPLTSPVHNQDCRGLRISSSLSST